MRPDSGEVIFYIVGNSADNGLMPKPTYTELHRSGFEFRTVGSFRYQNAQQTGRRIDALIRIPRTNIFDVNRSAEIVAVLKPYAYTDNAIYTIYQAQNVEDEYMIPATDVSLERMEGIDASEVINN